jgi:hypothetical protein
MIPSLGANILQPPDLNLKYSTAMEMKSGNFFTPKSYLKITADEACHCTSNRLLKRITCGSAEACTCMRKIQYVDETNPSQQLTQMANLYYILGQWKCNYCIL